MSGNVGVVMNLTNFVLYKQLPMNHFVRALLLSSATSLAVLGQTTLGAGDLVFIHYNSITNTTGSLAFISRVPILSGTSIHITNRQWVTTGSGPSAVDGFQTTQSDQGTISILFTENVSLGQVVKLDFQVNTANPTVTSSLGSVSFSGNQFDFGQKTGSNNLGQAWVYQGSAATPTFIAGLSWKGTPNPRPSTMIFTAGATQTAFDLDINGNSEKCGCWTQYTDPTNNTTAASSVNFSSTLNNSFYNRTVWIFATSNSINATLGINPCSPSPIYTYLESNVVYAKYRFGRTANQWDAYSYSTNSWTANVTAPNWTSDTRDKEVIIYQSLELGTFNASTPSSSNFECAVITLKDSVNNDITVSITPGNMLIPYFGVTMSDLNSGIAGSPKIHLKSSPDNTGKIHYAQIAPASSTLNGTYVYDLYIAKSGWHHLTSPIQSTLAQVTPVTQGAASLFAFDYTGATTGFPNVFHWIGNDANGIFWDTVRSNYSFHDRSYAINFASNQVPIVLRVSGPIRVVDQDAQTQETALFGQGASSTPGWGAPGWTTGITYNGWNFYGNPFLSFVSTRRNKTYYSALQTSLASLVYVWQPMRNNLSNGQNYYTHNGSTGDLQAALIPPFQGFFMQNTGVATNASGLIHGKKAQVVYGSSDSSISRKTQSSVEEYALSLFPPSATDPERIYLDQSAEMVAWEKSIKHDAPYSGNANEVFAILYDSTLYKIKRTPIITSDSLRLPVVVSFKGHAASFTIENHLAGSHYASIVIDHKTGQRQNLANQGYTFVNDTTYSNSRFTWVLKKNAMNAEEDGSLEAQYRVKQSKSEVTFTGHSNAELINSLSIYSLNGLEMISKKFAPNQEVTINTSNMPTGLYLAKINGGVSVIKFIISQ